MSFCSLHSQARKDILIIHSPSTHGHGEHRNKEVAYLIKKKLDDSQYANELNVRISFKYPKDTALIDNAELIILSSDGGTHHALNHPQDPTKNMKDLDERIKKNKAGIIVIHWATDCPAHKGFRLTPASAQNNPIMHRWIGAYYYWGESKSWTQKFPVKELIVNKKHPVGNGVAEKFKLQDEYYWNFFTKGKESRNQVEPNVVFIHQTMAGDHPRDKNLRIQSPYWVKTRDDGGRSAGMTSAHMYHTWANPHFFQTFMNTVFWTMNYQIPEQGIAISAPDIEYLKSFGKGATIHKNAKHFN